MSGKFLLIYICNFHVLSNLLLIYICKLHWRLLEGRAPQYDRVAKRIRNEILDEVVQIFCRNLSKFVFNIIVTSKKELDDALCESITSSVGGTHHYDNDGVFQLLRGVMTDELISSLDLKTSTSTSLDQTSSTSLASVTSMRIASANCPRPSPGEFLLIYICNFHVLSNLLLFTYVNSTGIQTQIVRFSLRRGYRSCPVYCRTRRFLILSLLISSRRSITYVISMS